MAFKFDDEWLRRLNRQMDDVRRAFASPAIEAALRQFKAIQPQFEEPELFSTELRAAFSSLR
jgi:hypothetical protein